MVLDIILITGYVVLLTVAGWRVGVYKGYPWSGAVGAALGFLLGLIGLLVIALVPSSEPVKRQRAQDRLRVERLARDTLASQQAAARLPGRAPAGAEPPGRAA